MKRNTLVTLIGAVLFGVLAVWLAQGWISDAVQSEYAASRPTDTVVEKKVPGLPVIVAKTDIAFGEKLTPDMLTIIEVPKKAKPLGTYASLEDLQLDPTRPTVALTPIAANEMVFDHRISGPGGRGSLSALITPGMRATTIKVNDVSGVGGFVVPGDRVDILYTRDEDQRLQENNMQSDLLLQNVKVLGIDQNLDDQTDDPSKADTLTLEVTPVDAQKLRLAQELGSLALSLRRNGETDLIEGETVSKAVLVGKSTSSSIVPTVRRPVRKPTPKPAGSTGSEIVVIRGDEREPVKVFQDPGKDSKTVEPEAQQVVQLHPRAGR